MTFVLYMAQADHAAQIPYADQIANFANVLLIGGLVGMHWFPPPFESSVTHDTNAIFLSPSTSVSSLWLSLLATPRRDAPIPIPTNSNS